MFAALKSMFDPKQKLRETLGDSALPSFKAVTMQTLRKLRDPEASSQEIAKLVASDPGLSVKVLSTVNSAAFGLRRPATDVGHAINLLGRGGVEGIVLGVAVKNALPMDGADGYDPIMFWRAAAVRAATAKALADALDPKHRMLSFTAGLLQDMAVPLLAHRASGYGRVLRAWHCGDVELEAAERHEYGWDHAEVAGWLASDWEFPAVLGDSIVGHHGGCDSPLPIQLVGLIHEDPRFGMDRVMDLARDRCGAAAEERVRRALILGQENGAAMAGLFR
ncbi:MAG TPA: HDOD domain-containing protein [Myxococcota bacterium]|nr:HDOD domain-containing protein [Myxococcota bacterium]